MNACTKIKVHALIYSKYVHVRRSKYMHHVLQGACSETLGTGVQEANAHGKAREIGGEKPPNGVSRQENNR